MKIGPSKISLSILMVTGALGLYGCDSGSDNDVLSEEYDPSQVETLTNTDAETSPAPKPGSTMEKRIAEYDNVKNVVSDNAPNSELNERLHSDKKIADADVEPDELRESPVPLVKAHYEEITFAKGSTELTNDARDEIQEFSEDLKKGIPSYVTVRAQDDDNIEPTEPSAEFARLTQPRVDAIRKVLIEHDIKIASIAVDEADIIENRGEGTVMAKPSNTGTESNDEVQYIVIAFNESDEQPEKIETNL